MGTESEEVQAATPAVEPEKGFGWRKVQGWGGVAILAAFIIIMALEGFGLFFVIMGAPVLVGLILLAVFKGRVGVIVMGLVGLALLAMNAPFILMLLAFPAAIADFIPISMFTVGALLMIIAAIPAFLQGPGPEAGSRGAVTVGAIAAVLILGAGITSFVAFSAFEDDDPLAGDLLVVVAGFEFLPQALSAEAGEVSVHVSNEDSALHTFTVDDLGVSLAVPGGRSVRTNFTAPAGNYEFYCEPHRDMTGTLTVR